MLMITVENEAAMVTFRVDGCLAGGGVDELARHWSAASSQPDQKVLVDVTGVTSVDGPGREFLAEVHRRGDTLVGGATTRAIVDEIRASALAGT